MSLPGAGRCWPPDVPYLDASYLDVLALRFAGVLVAHFVARCPGVAGWRQPAVRCAVVAMGPSRVCVRVWYAPKVCCCQSVVASVLLPHGVGWRLLSCGSAAVLHAVYCVARCSGAGDWLQTAARAAVDPGQGFAGLATDGGLIAASAAPGYWHSAAAGCFHVAAEPGVLQAGGCALVPPGAADSGGDRRRRDGVAGDVSSAPLRGGDEYCCCGSTASYC